MIIEPLKELYKRDLIRLKEEIKRYDDEAALWKVDGSIKNSGGNLCLHIIGNLKTYIGNGLAQIGYIREREREFSAKFIDRDELYKQIDETIEIVHQGLDELSEQQLQENFPILIWEQETSMVFTIIHLHSHLNYHLGQINYHRRVLEKQ